MSYISIIRMIISDNRNNLSNQGPLRPPLHNLMHLAKEERMECGGGLEGRKLEVLFEIQTCNHLAKIYHAV